MRYVRALAKLLGFVAVSIVAGIIGGTITLWMVGLL